MWTIRRLIFLTTMFLSYTIFFSSGCDRHNRNSNIVAKIENDYVITHNDLREFVFDRLYHRMYKNMSQAYHHALKVMVTNQLKCKDFLEKGWHRNEGLMQNIQRNISEELLVKYFNTQFLDKYTNEEFAHKMYSTMGREVIYQQIILFKPEKASKFHLDSLKNVALTIKADIEKGNDFGKLADKYSQYKQSSVSGGYMPPLGWEQSLSNPIDGLIFNLNIDDVQVLDTHNAYRIVRVTDIKEVDTKPFEEIKDEIKRKLRKSYIDISLREYDKAKNELIDVDSIKWNDNALDQLIVWSRIPNFYQDTYQDTIKNTILSENNFTILTHPGGILDLKEYLRLLNEILIPLDAKDMKKEDIKKFILEAMRTDKIVQKAKELQLEKGILDANNINAVLKNKIVNLYDQAVIASQIPEPTPELLHDFYESQKDSLYYNLKKVNIYAMIFSQKGKAEEAMQSIKDGTPFEEVTGRWLVKTFVRDRNGNIRLYKSQERHFLGEAAFKLKVDETRGPIQYDDPKEGKYYAIIKCTNIRPEKQLLFDDVKKSIVEDFEKYQKEKIASEIRMQLWKKYNVEIYEDRLTEKLSSVN